MLETMHRDTNVNWSDAHLLNRCIVSVTFFDDAPSESGIFPSLKYVYKLL